MKFALQKKHSKIVFLIIFLATFSIYILSFAGTEKPNTPGNISVSIEQQSNLITITASNTSLKSLLEELSSKAGFDFININMEDKEITFSCEKCPLNKLDKTLKNILKVNGVSSAFLYSKGEPVKLRRVIVLKAVNGKDIVEYPEVEETDSASESHIEVLNTEVTVEQLLTKADDTSDLNKRISAIESLLLHHTDDRVHKKLSDISNDPDFHLRLLALGLLGNFVSDWPEVEDILMRAMHDPEPSVRQLALQTLVENEGPHTKDALNIAIHDKDPLICNQAKEFLKDDSIVCEP